MWIVDLMYVLLGIPVMVFSLECLLGLFRPSRSDLGELPEDLRTVFLVPAHNEAAVIEETLTSLYLQLGPGDKLLVVADNCDDDTAALSAAAGAKVLERRNLEQRGKGYALDYGIDFLRREVRQPNLVVIVDADCQFAPGAVESLKRACIYLRRPVQARYLMQRGVIDRLGIKVAELAFLIKNQVRPRGLTHLGLPVPLTGTGMAFPWEVIAEAKLATGDIVEDMRLGVELVEAGNGARYCDEALVTSTFPQKEDAENTQRERWEHGHLDTMRRFVPRLVWRGLSRFQLSSLIMGLDLLVPPLSLLVVTVLAAIILSLVLAFPLGISYLQWSLSYLLLLLLSVGLAWLFHGRNILSFRDCLAIPGYIAGKLRVYANFLKRKQTQWIRTDRD